MDITARLAEINAQTTRLEEEAAVLAVRAIAERVREARPDVAKILLGWCDERPGCMPLAYYTADGRRIGYTGPWRDSWRRRLELQIVRLTTQLGEHNADAWFPLTTDEDENGDELVWGERYLVIDDALKLPEPDPRERILHAKEELAAAHEGNTTRALLDFADHYKIAVNYLDRDWFDAYLLEYHDRDEPLTDYEWVVQLGWLLDGYDEHVSNHRCWSGSVEHRFADRILADAGVSPLGDDQDDEQDDEQGGEA